MSFSLNAMLRLIAALLAATAYGAEHVLHVCCGCAGASDAASGAAPSSPLATIPAAQQRVRGLLPSLSPSAGDAITVLLAGACGPPAPFTALDSAPGVRVTFRSLSRAAPAALSGGLPLLASQFAPVTDPAILAQLPEGARASVRQLSLAAAGVTDAGALVCRPYMGGEASILPGNLMPSGAELFVLGDPSVGAGSFSPLTLARYPNRATPPKQWAGGTVDNYTITVDAATAGHVARWGQQLREDPGSVFVHVLCGYGWCDSHHALGSVYAPPTPARAAAPATAAAPPLNCSDGDWQSGIDMFGGDLQAPFPVASVGACCAACSALPGCAIFTHCGASACAGGEQMCYLKNSSAVPKAYPDRTSGPRSALPPEGASITLVPCPSHYAEPGYDALDNKGGFYAYNLLSELDEEGEYTINRTSGMLYAWLPAAGSSYWSMSDWGKPAVPSERPTATSHLAQHWGDGVIALLSINATILDLADVADVHFEDVSISESRNVGVRLRNTSGVTFTRVVLENFGSMALNASGGDGMVLADSTVRHAGNGAVFLYAGDRVTLTRSGHRVTNSSLSYSNRYMWCVSGGACGVHCAQHALCKPARFFALTMHPPTHACTLSPSHALAAQYVPMVALADCGNSVEDSELFGGPHQGVFISGNEHGVLRSSLHDLVQAASDSGAIYMGRDWTYRGNVISNNTFARINSALSGGGGRKRTQMPSPRMLSKNAFSLSLSHAHTSRPYSTLPTAENPGDDVSATYLDDMVSGFSITGNTFINVSRALLLGGGRDNLFLDNTIVGVDGGDAAVHFDNRGMGWLSNGCSGDGELVRFLARVPYNTSAAWIAAYPSLVHILEDQPCVPKGNVVVGNSYCHLGATPFVDASNASTTSWGSAVWGNTPCAPLLAE